MQDLRELAKSADPLLADVALEVLRQAVRVERRLKRIESATRAEGRPA